MSFDVVERSQERGAPVELYEFIYGPSEDMVYRYTNADFTVSAFGRNYTPIPIQRNSVKTNGKFEKTQVQLKMPINIPLSEMFLPYPPPQVVRCYIRQRHLSDDDQQAPIVWYGRVVSSGREGSQATLTLDNAILSWKRPGLKRHWQPGCPLLLYGPRCRADPDDFRVHFAVEDITPEGDLVFPDGWNGQWAKKQFVRGTVSWVSEYGTEYRTILRASDTGITWTGFTRGIEVGTELTMWIGCKHDMADCRSVFNNINNYGGQPWIPYKNPTKQHPFW
jgi:hypothetical protein